MWRITWLGCILGVLGLSVYSCKKSPVPASAPALSTQATTQSSTTVSQRSRLQEPNNAGPVDVLVAEFGKIAPWWAPNVYTEEDWAELMHVAMVVQRTEPNDVVEAIDRFVPTDKPLNWERLEHEMKMLLLLRVVFDLPEDATDEVRPFIWINPPDQSGRVNLAWPLSFSEGAPRLVGSGISGTGVDYRPVREYRYFRERYRYRRLNSGAPSTAPREAIHP